MPMDESFFDSSSQPVLSQAGQIVPATAALFIQIPTHNGCLQTNMTHQTIDGIPGEEIRGQEDQFQLERNGFTIQHGSPVQRFSRVEEVTKYLRLTERVSISVPVGWKFFVTVYNFSPTSVSNKLF